MGLTNVGKAIAGGVAAVLLLIAVAVLAGPVLSMNRVQANEWGCLYGGGPFESKALKETIAPGGSGGLTAMDKLVTIPADDRIYAVDNDPNTADFGGSLIVVPAKGSNSDADGIVPVVVPVQVRFTINENACELWNQHLKGKGGEIDWNGTADEPGRWPKLLNLQMNQPLITAVRKILSGVSYVELYTDFSKYPAYQTSVSSALTSALKASLGGEFFCGPSYQFDGEFDGVVEECPPIEITIKEITPKDPVFLNNLQTIVANQEQQTVIQSDRDRAIEQTNAERDKALAATEAERQRELAQTEADREVAVAKAVADAEVAAAFAEVVALQTANAVTKVQAETAFCERLANIGVNCVDYFKYQNYNPQVVLADDDTTPIIPLS